MRLLAVILGLCIIAECQSPTVQPKNPIVKNGASSSRERTTNDKQQTALGPSDELQIAPPGAEKGNAKEDQKQQEPTGRVYKVDVITPVAKPADTPLFPVYLWITGIGVFVNFLIWIAIFRQTKLNRIAARAAKESADAAKTSADFIVNTERAWVLPIISRPTGDYAVKEHEINQFGERLSPLEIKFDFKNFGKTPAVITTWRILFVAIKEIGDLPPQPDYGIPAPPQNSIMLPQEESFTDKQRIRILPNDPSGESAMILYAYGFIRYLDIFGQSRETRFGYASDAGKPKDILWRTPEIAGPPEYNKHT
jgi:hypothetical protein